MVNLNSYEIIDKLLEQYNIEKRNNNKYKKENINLIHKIKQRLNYINNNLSHKITSRL
jgi:hypothetical protein